MSWDWNRHHRSMYYGSMHGKPPLFFAVWGYILGHMQPTGTDDRDMTVELNPGLMSSVFGGKEHSPPEKILEVIEELCAPDPHSRTQAHEGRRLLTTDREPGLGPCTYIVVNGSKHSQLTALDERRAKAREAMRKLREKRRKLEGEQPAEEDAG